MKYESIVFETHLIVKILIVIFVVFGSSAFEAPIKDTKAWSTKRIRTDSNWPQEKAEEFSVDAV